MDLLIFKLVATPLLLAAASLAVRRWGAAVGGFLVGLPLTSGPISVFLALEHGAAFAVDATAGSLAATAAQAAYCFVYWRLAESGWPVALAASSAAFAGVAAVLEASGLPRIWLFPVAVTALCAALRLIPREASRASRAPAPWWDLPARMLLIAGLVVGITYFAPHLGPGPAGVLASFPLMASILAVFAHREAGPSAARQVMRGMVAGLFGFAAFFFIVGLALVPLGFWAYGCALAAALLLQATLLKIRAGA